MGEIDWAGVARGRNLDIPPESIEAATPVLDALLESFRPLVDQLDPIRDA